MARGNPSSKVTVRRRQAEIIDLVAEGMSQTEIAEELGVHRTTIYRNTLPLEIDWANANLAKLAPFKKKLVENIAARAVDVLNGEIEPDVANAWKGLMSELAKVVGLYEPTKSITAHINADPTGRFHKFVTAAAGLTDLQLEQVFEFARNLQREQLPMPDGPPMLLGE